MSEYPLIIFDVDGTLTATRSGETFRTTAYDWMFLPNRVEKCQELVMQGVKLAIASNQAGVAFPWSKFSEAEIMAELHATGAQIGAWFVAVCCTTPNAKALPQYRVEDDPRRKPNPGMLLEAMEHFQVIPEETLFVGDRPEDEGATIAPASAFAWSYEFFGDEL